MKSIGRVALLACWSLPGCAYTGFFSTSDLRPPARPEDCALDVVLDGRPRQPYVVIGRVSADSAAPGLFGLGETQEAVVGRIKAKACTVGAHVIFAVTAATNGRMSDDGYSTSTTGSALAAVYVDENGHPMPPPKPSIAEH
jgi:hypothetical protein